MFAATTAYQQDLQVTLHNCSSKRVPIVFSAINQGTPGMGKREQAFCNDRGFALNLSDDPVRLVLSIEGRK